jgi:hypothetical protein
MSFENAKPYSADAASGAVGKRFFPSSFSPSSHH